MTRETEPTFSIPARQEMLHYVDAHIPLDDINILPQPRKTFEDIDTLAQDLAVHDQLNPLYIAEFTPQQAQAYVDVINQMWKTEHKLDELRYINNKIGRYYILIAGERRYRAFKTLDADGCFNCQDNYGRGPCITRHFPDKKVKASLMVGVDPLEAIGIQAAENIHTPVPPEQEAVFYDAYFRVRKMTDETYTVSRFARDVGRGEGKITSAIKFCRLPEEIQNYVKDKVISYGHAIELQRARETLGLDAAGLDFWTIKVIVNRLRVPELREIVSREIEAQQSNQTLLGLFTQAQEEDMRKSYFKRTVAKESINKIWGFIDYFQTVLNLFENGKLGKKDSPFSERSPLRVFKALIKIEKRLISHLDGLLSEPELVDSQDVLDTSDLLIALLEKRQGDDIKDMPRELN
jgi:ParB-like chromosome segregation protein Spo0J